MGKVERLTGQEVERKLFGAIESRNVQEKAEYFWDFEHHEDAGEWTPKQALDEVKQMQPQNPSFPTADFAADLVDRLKVAFQMPRNSEQVRFYTAVTDSLRMRTALDLFKKIDGVVEIDTPRGLRTVTLDATSNADLVEEKKSK